MRKIKFRVYRLDTKELKPPFALEDAMAVSSFHEPLNVTKHVVMQYTGFRDKNGKEIYEGDVIQFLSHKGDVYWDESGLWAAHWNEQKYNERLFVFNQKKFEVIGNIYENPELLRDHLERIGFMRGKNRWEKKFDTTKRT
jgi:uncharacterized phage protein (TIGR01671 family)